MDDPAKFRARATRVYRVLCVALVGAVIAAGYLGWHWHGWRGLLIGSIIGLVVAAAFWFGATLIWVMSQDGA